MVELIYIGSHINRKKKKNISNHVVKLPRKQLLLWLLHLINKTSNPSLKNQNNFEQCMRDRAREIIETLFLNEKQESSPTFRIRKWNSDFDTC